MSMFQALGSLTSLATGNEASHHFVVSGGADAWHKAKGKFDVMCLADTATGKGEPGLVDVNEGNQYVSGLGTQCCNGQYGIRPGCRVNENYQQAKKVCEAEGMRLCTTKEVRAGHGEGTGCKFDYCHVWVSDSCSNTMAPTVAPTHSPTERIIDCSFQAKKCSDHFREGHICDDCLTAAAPLCSKAQRSKLCYITELNKPGLKDQHGNVMKCDQDDVRMFCMQKTSEALIFNQFELYRVAQMHCFPFLDDRCQIKAGDLKQLYHTARHEFLAGSGSYKQFEQQ